MISERWETMRSPSLLPGQSLKAAGHRGGTGELRRWSWQSGETKAAGAPGQSIREERVSQKLQRSADGFPQVFSRVLISKSMYRNYPKPGKEPPKSITESIPQNPYRAGNNTCFHQPNWKNSWFLGLVEYSKGSCVSIMKELALV